MDLHICITAEWINYIPIAYNTRKSEKIIFSTDGDNKCDLY